MSKDPGYSDSKKDTLESNNRSLRSELDKVKVENEKLIGTLRLFAFPEGKLEHEDVERVSRQVLKELGDK